MNTIHFLPSNTSTLIYPLGELESSWAQRRTNLIITLVKQNEECSPLRRLQLQKDLYRNVCYHITITARWRVFFFIYNLYASTLSWIVKKKYYLFVLWKFLTLKKNCFPTSAKEMQSDCPNWLLRRVPVAWPHPGHDNFTKWSVWQSTGGNDGWHTELQC